MIRTLAICAALLFALPAAAQDAPPTAEEIAAARAHADKVIEAANAGEWFVNITTTETPRVRHKASGMTCEFVGQDERDLIRFYEAPGGMPRGDDVSCNTWIGRTYVSVFATRYPERHSEEELMAIAVRQVAANWPVARPYEGDVSSWTLPGQEEPLIAAFEVEREGHASRSFILIRNLEDWSFKARVTGPNTDDSANELGGMAFAVALPGGLDALNAALAATE